MVFMNFGRDPESSAAVAAETILPPIAYLLWVAANYCYGYGSPLVMGISCFQIWTL